MTGWGAIEKMFQEEIVRRRFITPAFLMKRETGAAYIIMANKMQML